MTSEDASTPVSLEGSLERVTFLNPDNHYTIARFKPANAQPSVTVVGYLPGVHPGDNLRLEGNWTRHPRFGLQLKVSAYDVILPETIDGIRKYLSSGLIRGVGKVAVDRLIDHFGEQTLTVIETQPQRLTEVKGIGAKTARKIDRSWQKNHVVRHLIRFLQENGITPAYCARILETYGDQAVAIIEQDPYQVVTDIPAIGFYVADAIALTRGLAKTDPRRVRACVLNELNRAAGEGHTHMPAARLAQRCRKTFEIPAEKTALAVEELSAQGRTVLEQGDAEADQCVYLQTLHAAESVIARRLTVMRGVPLPAVNMNADVIAHTILKRLAISLSSEQQAVVEAMLNHHLAVITGGPGTGKTTLIQAFHVLYEALGKQVVQAAPTGRAAKRLSEVTRRPAATIHRLLGYNPHDEGFEYNPDQPIDADVVIIDEASMVDVILMHHLIEALHMQTRLILVGDVFQLPSVGPGNVLGDLIASGVVKVFELHQIFRQAQKSPIVLNAHRVRRGRPPLPAVAPPDQEPGEFYFIQQRQPQKIVQIIVELCRQRIPHSFDLDPVRDVQVITPMHKGEVGTLNLNQTLQAALNPGTGDGSPRQGLFRRGDKVMHLKNNYQKEVFNGDIGTVATVNRHTGQMTVDFEDRRVEYGVGERGELTLAYAISVHKSQGSEYPAVILPLVTEHYAMLQRNLLYTAMTRGRRLVVLIGTQRALQIALDNDRPRQRLSSLSRRLA